MGIAFSMEGAMSWVALRICIAPEAAPPTFIRGRNNVRQNNHTIFLLLLFLIPTSIESRILFN